MRNNPLRVQKIVACKTAFTIIELLVVIAIIVVLAALLFPAIKSFKSNASTVECTNNLRQLASLAQVWSIDNDGFSPPALFFVTYDIPGLSIRNFDQYGLTEAGLICPASGLTSTTYGINLNLVSGPSGDPAFTQNWGPLDSYFWSRGRYRMVALSSRTILFADTGKSSWSSNPPKSGSYAALPASVSGPHKGKALLSYADGHVGSERLVDLQDPLVWSAGIPTP